MSLLATSICAIEILSHKKFTRILFVVTESQSDF